MSTHVPETTQPEALQQVELDPVKVTAFEQRLRDEENIVLGIVGGAVAAVVGAAVWAAVTVATLYQIGWMAVGIGCIVGIAVRLLGRGTTQRFGVAGAVLALLGCLLGNLLSVCGLLANQFSISFFSIFSQLDLTAIVELMKVTFSPMDLLFYAIAVYEGYKFSIRQVTSEELQSLVKTA